MTALVTILGFTTIMSIVSGVVTIGKLLGVMEAAPKYRKAVVRELIQYQAAQASLGILVLICLLIYVIT